jgi:hypothetical protein
MYVRVFYILKMGKEVPSSISSIVGAVPSFLSVENYVILITGKREPY